MCIRDRYVVDCGPDAALRVGFDGPVTREQYAEHVERGTLPELMAKARVHPGDTFFIPAGTVHTIEGSVLIAEIQQASDITYRIYDWDLSLIHICKATWPAASASAR